MASVFNCQACKHPITSGRKVNALDGWFHGACFICDQCQMPLVVETFHLLDDGRKVCQACRNRIICVSCNMIVADNRCYEALGCIYHKECFRCSTCGELLNGKFLDHANKIYCGKCCPGSSAGGEVCPKCQQPLSGSVIKACGARWHDPCFVCWSCSKPFPNDLFSNKAGKPYCDDCVLAGRHNPAYTTKPAVATSATSGYASSTGSKVGIAVQTGQAHTTNKNMRQGSVTDMKPSLPARDNTSCVVNNNNNNNKKNIATKNDNYDDFGEERVGSPSYGMRKSDTSGYKTGSSYQGGKMTVKLKNHVEQWSDMGDFAFSSDEKKRTAYKPDFD